MAAFILVLSMAALIQFAAFTWRAAFLGVAIAELSEGNRKSIGTNDFEEASAYQRLCPELGVGGGSNLRSVGLYYRFLQFLTSVGDAFLPPASGWAQREMVLCTRYATVVLAQRLDRNQIRAAEVCSF